MMQSSVLCMVKTKPNKTRPQTPSKQSLSRHRGIFGHLITRKEINRSSRYHVGNERLRSQLVCQNLASYSYPNAIAMHHDHHEHALSATETEGNTITGYIHAMVQTESMENDKNEKETQTMFDSVQDIFDLVFNQTTPSQNEMIIYDNAITSQIIEMKPMNTKHSKKTEEANKVVEKLENALSYFILFKLL